jgi:hypothetical protein
VNNNLCDNTSRNSKSSSDECGDVSLFEHRVRVAVIAFFSGLVITALFRLVFFLLG